MKTASRKVRIRDGFVWKRPTGLRRSRKNVKPRLGSTGVPVQFLATKITRSPEFFRRSLNSLCSGRLPLCAAVWPARSSSRRDDCTVFGNAPIKNPSTQWERRLVGDRKVVLGVLQFDDLGDMFPDEKNGRIRLYQEGSQPIFTYLSYTDLMLHWMRTARRPRR